MYGTTTPLSRRSHPAPARPRPLDHRADRLDHIQPADQHKRRQQRMAHLHDCAPDPAHQYPPAAAAPREHDANTPTRNPSAPNTTGSPDAGTPPPGPPAHTHRPTTSKAIRWTQVATPPWGPSRPSDNSTGGVPSRTRTRHPHRPQHHQPPRPTRKHRRRTRLADDQPVTPLTVTASSVFHRARAATKPR